MVPGPRAAAQAGSGPAGFVQRARGESLLCAGAVPGAEAGDPFWRSSTWSRGKASWRGWHGPPRCAQEGRCVPAGAAGRPPFIEHLRGACVTGGTAEVPSGRRTCWELSPSPSPGEPGSRRRRRRRIWARLGVTVVGSPSWSQGMLPAPPVCVHWTGRGRPRGVGWGAGTTESLRGHRGGSLVSWLVLCWGRRGGLSERQRPGGSGRRPQGGPRPGAQEAAAASWPATAPSLLGKRRAGTARGQARWL